MSKTSLYAKSAGEEAIEAFKDDRVCESVLLLRECKEEDIEESEMYKAIKECESEIVAHIKNTMDTRRWRPCYEHRGIKVSLDNEKDGNRLLRIRCEGIVKTDAFAICASLFECEEFTDWMPGIDESIIIKEISKFRKIIRVSGPKPWPIRRDELAVEAYGDVVDCNKLLGVNKSGVCVYIKTATGDSIPKTKGRHQMELVGGWWIEPLSENETLLCLIARVDPKLRFCPSWLINFVVKNIAYRFIPMVAKQAESFKPGGKNYHRIHSQPEIYDEIKRRLDLMRKTPPESTINPHSKDVDEEESCGCLFRSD